MEPLCIDKGGTAIFPGAFVKVTVTVRKGKRRMNGCKQLTGIADCMLGDRLFVQVDLKAGHAIFYACWPHRVKVIRDPETESK